MFNITFRKKKVEKKKTRSVGRNARAGLQFPISRIHRSLRQSKYAKRIGVNSSVYLAAVLQYLTTELLELAGDMAHSKKRSRITPQHIQLAIRNDDELCKLLSDVVIAEGGVVPNINPALLPKQATIKKEENSDKNDDDTE